MESLINENNLSSSEQFEILKRGLSISNDLESFNADELDRMMSLPRIDYLKNLLDPARENEVSSSYIYLYSELRLNYNKRTPLEKLKFVAKSSELYNPNKIKKNDLDSVPLDVLSLYLKINYPEEDRFKNTLFWQDKVATKEEIIIDLVNAPIGFDLIPRELVGNLTPRAVVGHAQNGHCEFSMNAKPNTTLEDVINDDILIHFKDKNKFPYYKSAKEFLFETQKYIDNVAELVDMAVDPNIISSIDNKINSSKLLFNFNFLKGLPVNLHAFLKGVSFGGYFDNYEDVRSPIFERYGVEMGGGRTWLVNKKMLMGLGIGIQDLNKSKYKDEIIKHLSPKRRMELFHYSGLVKKDTVIDYKHAKRWQDILDQSEPIPKGYFQEYIRDIIGPGGSDDILCMSAAWIDFNPKNIRRDPLWYFWLQMGARSTDFVDTLTKSSARYLPGGQDKAIAKFANAAWLDKVRNTKYYASEIGVDRHKLEKNLEKQGNEDFALVLLDELIDMTAVGINPSKYIFSKSKDPAIHSSARYFSKAQSSNGIDYTNFNDSSFSKGVTTAMDQQIFVAHKYLKKLKANVELDGKFIHPLVGSSEIGFQKHPLAKVVEYFSRYIFPVISKPLKRKELLERFFSMYKGSKYEK